MSQGIAKLLEAIVVANITLAHCQNRQVDFAI